jgi:hypothetical protein
MRPSKLARKEESTDDPLAVEERSFVRKRAQLLRKYKGEFVALYQGAVIGHGADDEELARQMFEKVGDVPFYIGKVGSPATVYDVPSPEVGRG